LLKICNPETILCIAKNLTTAEESVVVKTIAGWRKIKADLDKQPAVFLIQA